MNYSYRYFAAAALSLILVLATGCSEIEEASSERASDKGSTPVREGGVRGPASAPAPEVIEIPEAVPPPPSRDPIWAWDRPRDAISRNYPSTLLFGISYRVSERELSEYLANEFRRLATSQADATETGTVRNAPATRYRYLGLRIQCIPPEVLVCGTGENTDYKNVSRDPMIWQQPISARENVSARGQIIIDVLGKRTRDGHPEQLETIPSVDIPIEIERDPIWLTLLNWIVEHWEALAGIGATIGGAIGALAAALHRRKNRMLAAN